jgi:hypothetical protein
MQAFFQYLQTSLICGTALSLGLLLMLAWPHSRLPGLLCEFAKWAALAACSAWRARQDRAQLLDPLDER